NHLFALENVAQMPVNQAVGAEVLHAVDVKPEVDQRLLDALIHLFGKEMLRTKAGRDVVLVEEVHRRRAGESRPKRGRGVVKELLRGAPAAPPALGSSPGSHALPPCPP